MKKETVALAPSTRKKQRPQSRLFKPLIITVAFLFVVSFAWEFLAAAVSKVQLLTKQEVGQTTSLEGILIKEEKVIKSSTSGLLQFTVPDGTRLEMGAGAARVRMAEQKYGGETFNIFTTTAGIFCTHLDGLENILSPGNLDVLDLSKLEKIVSKPIPEGAQVEKGQPVFKIIDNLSPISSYAKVPKSDFPPDLMDKPRWLQATWENLPLLIKPRKLTDKGDRWEGFFTIINYPENLIHYRKVRLNVTTKLLTDLLVPRKAIVYREGEPGIYLAVKKKARWSPVKIEGELAGKVAISGRELGEGTRYVSNPVLVREGWPVE